MALSKVFQYLQIKNDRKTRGKDFIDRDKKELQ